MKTRIFVEKSRELLVMLCAIWYHLHNLTNVKTPIEVLVSVKLQASDVH